MKRALIASGLVVTALACESGARRQAQQLVSAVERFRRADNPAKPATVAAIRDVSCTDPDVCGAREACLAAAESTGKALELKSEVQQGLAALERGQLAKESPEAQVLPSKLDMAEALLKEGHARLGACEDQIAALKRKHRI
jgi:hypothetical protein